MKWVRYFVFILQKPSHIDVAGPININNKTQTFFFFGCATALSRAAFSLSSWCFCFSLIFSSRNLSKEEDVLAINPSQKDLHQYYLIKNYLNTVKSPLRLNENNTSSSPIIVGFEYSGEISTTNPVYVENGKKVPVTVVEEAKSTQILVQNKHLNRALSSFHLQFSTLY